MKIGIDISSLQGAHRLRGIGYVASNFLKNIPSSQTATFALYVDENGEIPYEQVISELNLEHINYEVRKLQKTNPRGKNLPGKLKYFSKASRRMRELVAYLFGDSRVKDTSDLDAFLQLDQSAPLPRLRIGGRLYFIAYDLIPYVLEADYLWNFRTSRRRGLSRKAALKASVRRSLYITMIRLNSRRATKIFAISKTTKRDFEKYARTPVDKIVSVTLGLSVATHKKSTHDGMVKRYHSTSWGYLPKNTSLNGERFLLFVGGADHRRKLDDLVAAFNHLCAENINIKLVLSGDSMQGPRNIATHSIQSALAASAYPDDIYYLGFSDDLTRDWLYENALAFVFPSVYEGFGLPVLEAMSYGTPVICYKNSAVTEVASSIPLYATDTLSIKKHVLDIINSSEKETKQRAVRGIKQAAKYRWSDVSSDIMNHITSK